MTLSIQAVSEDNWQALIELKVREDQTHYVGSNLFSIAESQFGFNDPDSGHWDLYPFGIYQEELPIGFLMYGYNFDFPGYQAFIFRLMVDQNQQGKGFGKFAMQKMLEIFSADDRIQCVGISYKPDNERARKLYASLGFIETGKMLSNELEAVINLVK